jgi:protein-disulfide isomerase
VSSRQDEKQRLAEERRGAEAAEQERQRRQRLVKFGAAAVLAAIIVVAAAIVISQSGDDDDEGSESSAAETRLLNTLPHAGYRLGEASAPVTVTEFGDLQCPACAQFSQTDVADLIAGPVNDGEAKIEFQNWVVIGPESVTAAKAALAAAEQDRYWNFITAFYANQEAENSGYVTDDFLTDIAEQAGVPDLEQWNQDREDPRWNAQIAGAERMAQQLGFQGTPSFLVRGPGGVERLSAPVQFGALQDAVESLR